MSLWRRAEASEHEGARQSGGGVRMGRAGLGPAQLATGAPGSTESKLRSSWFLMSRAVAAGRSSLGGTSNVLSRLD